MNPESRCETHLSRIAELLPLLLDALERTGSHKTSSNSAPTMDQVESFKIERAERDKKTNNINCLPDSNAPMDLDVSMAISEMRITLAQMHATAMQIIGLPQTCTRCAHKDDVHSTGPCTQCRTCLNFRLALILPTSKSWGRMMASDPRVATAIEASLARVVSIMELALDLSDSGQLIRVPCPWCRGVSPSMPGGSLTLRVFVPGAAPDTYVLCTNKRCEPPSADCGERWLGQPRWNFPELDWLAQRLEQSQALEILRPSA